MRDLHNISPYHTHFIAQHASVDLAKISVNRWLLIHPAWPFNLMVKQVSVAFVLKNIRATSVKSMSTCGISDQSHIPRPVIVVSL